ncbi:MAG: MarR family transcriptional regulator [Propionicimonas sp.]|uniref:MarR family winged helix-turn-helix transcriptional regulator n=1 Tax=Propionicimonas sp. TaxID=1955623 RepID=UPI001D8F05F9|nr:MarR family transcriptional regulator [Propionicimonas sp.]MBU4187557.1 MarR family transcriptional regulator [Actinomycetota bacterium]MBU4207660.1 MarR family transcriptional regulator [Actinomycetota bacterium]MBU4249248.1 MarR family transcriptional regulator [Actinomycetota bacterium]MBU4364545.1 MarR family transcriptional regulator [Actinomycetota bacterium]MBU4410997.1 MarR family transcriptional regulator [Actinomycetota bacterium]
MDEVDRILASWAKELPELDTSPLASLSRISRLSRHLDRARSEAFAAAELEPWEFDVLAALRRQGPPYELSPGELIHETLSTSGTMTNRVDRLQARGLVHRRPNSADRRSVLVRLTEDGRLRVQSAMTELLGFERRVLAPIAPAQRDQLADLLRTLLAPFERS